MLAIAHSLDALLELVVELKVKTVPQDSWGNWGPFDAAALSDDDPPTAPLTAEVDEHGDVEVNIKPVTDPGRLAERRALAHAMELDTNLAGVEDAIDVYVKGGPLWLYTGNRDFVMSLPMAMRQQMVLDVEQDDVKTAHEMGRDLLKDPNPGELPSLSGG